MRPVTRCCRAEVGVRDADRGGGGTYWWQLYRRPPPGTVDLASPATMSANSALVVRRAMAADRAGVGAQRARVSKFILGPLVLSLNRGAVAVGTRSPTGS